MMLSRADFVNAWETLKSYCKKQPSDCHGCKLQGLCFRNNSPNQIEGEDVFDMILIAERSMKKER